MLKSMTAYGRAALSNNLGRFSVELKSVNRRYLEIAMQLPPELMRFEVNIKKWISRVVLRGQVLVKLTADFDSISPVVAKPNLNLARHLKAAWDAIAQELNIPAERAFKLSMLADQEKIITFEDNLLDEEAFEETLHNVINMALEKLTDMKLTEGRQLHNDLLTRLDKLQARLNNIALLAPAAEERYRQRLLKRLEELLPGLPENENSVIREAALFAERIDITEEIVRFDSHIKQFTNLINGSESGNGKTLDFILQEMLREANTIGSKSSELEISQLVIECKSELERIREQIQNIE